MTKKRTISFCQHLNLIANSIICKSCNKPMVLEKSGRCSDGYRWRCRRPCRREVSTRVGSIFSKSKLKMRVILQLLYYWIFEEASCKKIKRELKISKTPLVKWKYLFRTICGYDLLMKPNVIGGVDHVVQIDETLYVRRKYNRGRLVGQQWVFGGIDCQTKECFLVPVEKRDAETLLPIILQYIKPGTTIVSDMWSAYNSINSLGFQHFRVNHSLYFVDPVTRVNTNRVENLWMRAKTRNKREAGTSRRYFESYLVEFMWRQANKNDTFAKMVEVISLYYPLNSTY